MPSVEVFDPEALHVQHVITYLNTQLYGLWKINKDNLEYIDKNRDSDDSEIPTSEQRYDIALAKYFYGRPRSFGQPSWNDMMFQIDLEQPQLSFLCNHHALLTVKIKKGHYNLRYSRGMEASIATHDGNQDISDLAVTLRFPFQITGIKGYDRRIADDEVIVVMFTFDFEEASLLSLRRLANNADEVSLPKDGDKILEACLQDYLLFLRSAGHHVLHSLPNFDAGNRGTHADDPLSSLPGGTGGGARHTTFDFSGHAKILLDLTEVQGIAIKSINQYLLQLWVKAVMELAGLDKQEVFDRGRVSLAEYRSTWLADGHRRIDGENGSAELHWLVRFSAPKVKALCNNELVIYFHLEDVLFYKSENFEELPSTSFRGWTIAVLVDAIVRPQQQQNAGKECIVDLLSSHYMEHLSTFTVVDQRWMDYQKAIVAFVIGDYMNILESALYHTIYNSDVKSYTAASGDDESSNTADIRYWKPLDDAGVRSSSWTTSWRSVTEKCKLYLFDQVIAISQTAINDHFFTMWTNAQKPDGLDPLLNEWSSEDGTFRVKLGYLSVGLPRKPGGTCILTLHVVEGSVMLPTRSWTDGEDDSRSISNWRLVFEVDLKLCDAESGIPGAEGGWTDRLGNSEVFRSLQVPLTEGRVQLHHVFLDIQNARYIHDASRFGGLAMDSRTNLDVIHQGIIHLRDSYLLDLVASGYHVLHTIPVWKDTPTAPAHGLTHISLYVYSKPPPADPSQGDPSRSLDAMPTIVILGMCQGRVAPGASLDYSGEWVMRKSRYQAFGTVAISCDAFLKAQLLPQLSSVNASTTIIPSLTGMDNHLWKFELTCWKDHPNRQDLPCDFSLTVDTGDTVDKALTYGWEHYDRLVHEHKSSDFVMNGDFSVGCKTINRLSIPTAFRHGLMEIKLHGRVDLILEFNHRTPSGVALAWQMVLSAEWTALLLVRPEQGQLRVQPVNNGLRISGPTVCGRMTPNLADDPVARFKKTMPQHVDLQGAADTLQFLGKQWQSFYPGMSACTIAQPAFNKDGDLFVELRPISTSLLLHSGQSSSRESTNASRSSTPHSDSRKPVRGAQISFGDQRFDLARNSTNGSHQSHGDARPKTSRNPDDSGSPPNPHDSVGVPPGPESSTFPYGTQTYTSSGQLPTNSPDQRLPDYNVSNGMATGGSTGYTATYSTQYQSIVAPVQQGQATFYQPPTDTRGRPQSPSPRSLHMNPSNPSPSRRPASRLGRGPGPAAYGVQQLGGPSNSRPGSPFRPGPPARQNSQVRPPPNAPPAWTQSGVPPFGEQRRIHSPQPAAANSQQWAGAQPANMYTGQQRSQANPPSMMNAPRAAAGQYYQGR